MSLFTRSAWVVVMVLGLIAPSSLAAEPDVLKLVPDNAQLVIVIKNLGELNEKTTNISKSLGLSQPELDNPLQQFKDMTGLGEGLNDQGSVAVVLQNLPLDGSEPNWLMLLPVKDYKAFANNFGATGEAASPIEFQGQSAFIKKNGAYAALSNVQPLLDAKPAAAGSLMQKSGALGAQLLGENDAVVFFDISTIGPSMLPLVQMQMDQAITAAQQQPGNPQAMIAAQGVAAVRPAVQALMRDGQALVMGLGVSEQGFGVSFGAQFRADSPTAKTFAGSTIGEPSFDRLPKKPFFTAVSMNLSSLPLNDWIDQVVAVLPPGTGMDQVVKAGFDLVKQSGGVSQSMWLAPSAGGGSAGLMNMINVYPVKDPAKFIAEQRKAIEGLNNLAPAPGISFQTSYKENAVEVGGKKVDMFTQKINLPPEATAQLGPAGGVLPTNTTGYVAAVDGAVVIATGADPTTLTDTFAAAAGKGGLGAEEQIKSIRPHLLKNRVVEGYLGVGTVIQFANSLLAFMSPENVIEAPKDLAPIAWGISASKGGVGTTLYVPMGVVETAMKAARKFQGSGSGSAGAAAGLPAPEEEAESEFVATFTDANFETEALQATQPVLVDFWAVWCGPCKAQAPIVASLAEQYKGKIKVGKLDIDENADTADLYQVEAIPTLLIIKDGQVVQKLVGLQTKEKLDAAIQQALR